MNNFIEKNKNYFLLAITMMVMITTCNTFKTKNMVDEVLSKKTVEVECVSVDEINAIFNAQLKDFLRYEDDIDRGKRAIEDVMAEIDKK